MTKGDKYLKQIQQAAGDKPPVPDASKVYTSAPAQIPRRQARGYEYTATGLDIQRSLTREEFRTGLLPEIETMQTRYQLIVGDAAVHGLDNGLIDSYEDMATLTGYTAGSIEVYASVCRNIPRLTRVNSLRFKHYQVIARLDEDERPHWINFAATYNLGYRVIESLIAEIDANIPALSNGDIVASLESIPGVTVEYMGTLYAPAPSDEIDDVTDDEIGDFLAPEHKQRRVEIEKKVKQNRWADIDLNDILAEERRLKWLRKKVAQAKVEAGRQARKGGK